MEQAVLAIINETRKILPGPRLLHEFVSTTSGDATAVEFLQADGQRVSLSYNSFDTASQELAEQILDENSTSVDKQHIIPVIIPQCPELYVALRAVLRAGASFCPVQPDVPPERLKFIIKDTSADLILCLEDQVQHLQHVLTQTKRLVVSLRDLQHRERRSRPHQRLNSTKVNIRATALAYVMYTSGSTGSPKGVKISHRSITQSLLAHEEHIPIFKRFLQFASPTFDVSVFEIFFPFFRGATLVGRHREHLLADLPGTIRWLQADVVELTPTVVSTLLRKRSAASCLRILFTIGEMLTRSVIEEFGGSDTQESILFAMYGPTEASVHCTIAPRLSASASVRSIGRPLSTATAVVLKVITPASLKLAEVGEPGELAIAGQLADGYLNRSEQDREAFTNLPGVGRIYRTGDRAVCTADGGLEIIGRMSAGQVKLRGQRVELGEIEEVASRTGGVAISVAIIIDSALVLFCESQSLQTSADVYATCKAWLPPFMRPSDVLVLKQLSKLSSGKADRKQLEIDYRSGNASRAEAGDLDLMSQTERVLAEALAQVFGQSLSKFTELWSNGLDSLRAIQVVAQLRQSFPNISVKNILDSSNIAELASRVARPPEPPSVFPADPPSTPENWSAVKMRVMRQMEESHEFPITAMPCSPMQTAMLTETAAKGTLNFNSIKLRTAPDLSETDMWTAICQLSKRNEIVRSGFVFIDDPVTPWVQIVWTHLRRHELDLLHPLQLTCELQNGKMEMSLHMHHALYDGWSWELMLDDLNTILEGSSATTRPQYADFALQQRYLAQMTELEYWEQLLENSGTIQLQSLAASATKQEPRFTISKRFSISYSRLVKLAADLRVSRQSFLQAGWAVLLSAYTNATDVLFAIISSGRHVSIQGVEKIIGPCLSTLPFRVDLSSLRTVKDLLLSIQRQWLRSLDHSNVSLRDILKSCASSTGSRPFDSLFVWQEGLERSPIQRKFVSTSEAEDALDYAAILEAEPANGLLHARLRVDTALIPEAHAKLLLQQLDAFLSITVENADVELTDVWADAPEHLTSISNTTYDGVTNDVDILDTVKRIAIDHPNRIAVKFIEDFNPDTRAIATRTLSYGELYAMASTVAMNLWEQHHIKPDELVAIIAEKTIDFYAVIAGIYMSGAGYFCIDPSTPAKRMESIISQARCALVLVEERVGQITLNVKPPKVPMTGILEAGSDFKQSAHAASPHHLAYVVFTSGTTGTPKGVLLTRRNLASNIRCLAAMYPCDPESDSVLQACSLAFDVSVFEIFWTWHMGMTLLATSNDVLFRDAEGLIRELGVTHLSLTPSVAALIHPDNVPKVKMLVTAGEPMNSKVFHSWADRGLWQGYGPAETTVICNVRSKVRSVDAQNNVGPPLRNTSIFICANRPSTNRSGRDGTDVLSIEDFTPLPRGAVGEIWVGGEQVGRGYSDESLTRQSFLNHPKYGWLYRSGDIGRLLADESLVILGRVDDQVKLRGQRIELGEINNVLSGQESVLDAVTIIEGREQEQRLLVFCVVKHAMSSEQSKAHVARLFGSMDQHLPTYMIPDTVIPISELPLTKQGKIDKRELLNMYQSMSSGEVSSFSRNHATDSDVAQLDGIEMTIAQALSQTIKLPLESIRSTSSFYALGLDSISAIRLSQALTRRDFARLDVSTILKNPSVKRLATVVGQEHHPEAQISQNPHRGLEDSFEKGWLQNLKIRFLDAGHRVQSILPCTDLQVAMLSSSGDTESRAYQNSMRFEVRGDVKRLKHAWDLAIRRHDLLRAVFVRGNLDMPFAMVVLEQARTSWNGSDGENIDSYLPNVLLRPLHLTIRSTDHQIIELRLDVHHALYDLEAMTQLLLEVQSSYGGEPLSAPVSFESFLEYAKNVDHQMTEEYWKSQLHDLEPCRLSDRLEHSSDSRERTMESASIKYSSTLKQLEDKARELEVSTLSLFQCALVRLLLYCFDSQDVCFGNVLSGRNLPFSGVEHIFGPLFNTLPVRVQTRRNTSNRSLSSELHDLNLEMLPYQTSSLRKLQRDYSPDGRGLFDVLLLLQQPQPDLDPEIWKLLEDTGDMSFPFILEVTPDPRKNELMVTLHSEVCGSATLRLILECFGDLLQHSIQYSQASVTDFACLTESPPLRLSIEQTRISQGTAPRADESWPWTTAEIAVRDILLQRSPLKLPHITRNTTLFNFGMDSIHAVQVAAQLRQLGYKLSSSDIMNGPQISEIAKRCTGPSPESLPEKEPYDLAAFDQKHKATVCQQGRLDVSSVEAVRPCTSTQCGIITQYLTSSGRFYYNTLHLRLDRKIDLGRLRKSWQAIMIRHEMLRTGFVESQKHGFPFLMVTYRPNAAQLPWKDESELDHLSADRKDTEREIEHLLTPPWKLDLLSDDSDLYLDITLLHALYDALSLDMILADVAQHYLGHETAEPVALSSALSSILAHAAPGKAKAFWLESANLIQPTKFPDLNIYSGRPRTASVVVRKASTPLGDFRHKASNVKSSFQGVCQAAWAKVLAAYCGQHGVTFGLVVSGRNFDDARNDAVLPCINTLPCTVETRCTPEELVTQISAFNTRSSRHQHTPLTSIKQWQKLDEEAFDTILVLQSFESKQPKDAPWTVVDDHASAEYAVSLEVLPDEEKNEICFRVTYSEHVLPPEAAGTLVEELDAFVRELLGLSNFSMPETNFSALPAQHDHLPSDLRFLHEMVERSAQCSPDATALEFVRKAEGINSVLDAWTYKQLDEEANRVAHLLIQNRVATGDLIALCFNKCPEASFAILGVLKAGCGYLAIDPGAPKDRKKFIIQDSRAQIVLSTRDLLSDFADNKNVVALDNESVFQDLPGTKPELNKELDPQDTCYCLYTSGTTGTPKGCLISHESAVQAMLSFGRIFEGHWTAESRWLQFASFHFDVSVLEQYWSWYVGICVVSAPRDLIFEDLPGFINKMKITHLDLTPSLARMLTPKAVPSLCEGVFIVGGEQVGRDIIETWGGVGCLYNFYGPSEVTIGCTVRHVMTTDCKSTNIGQQWDNVGTFVLEPCSENPVIRGAVGELCLSGVLVGKGYLNRSELTAKSFVSLKSFDTKVYRTGDLVRLLHDDSFEFLGRIDDQIKLRGQRLEIGEINQVIRSSFSEIKGVATNVAEHPAQGKEQLVAFFTISAKERQDVVCHVIENAESRRLSRLIRKSCMAKLPGYMVPTTFLMINFMPLTINNKIDNKKLKELYATSFGAVGSQAKEIRDERHDSESYRQIVDVLADFFSLSATQIVPASSLFELGLDSISAFSLSRKLRTQGFANANVATVMQNSLVADLVESLHANDSHDAANNDLEASKERIKSFAAKHRDTAIQALGIDPEDVEAIVHCTPLQEGMLSKVTSASSNDLTYFTQFHHDLKQGIDLVRLRQSWRTVQNSTSILRTHFVPTNDGFAQVVLKHASHNAGVEGEDVPWSKTAFSDWAKSVRSSAAAVPWRLTMNPTWGKTYMTLFIFHGLYDAISLDLILQKVASIYEQGQGQGSISDFHNILAHGLLRPNAGAKAFWSSHLQFVQRLDLSSKYPARQPYETIRLPTKQALNSKGINDVCSKLNITTPAVFQAAWLLTLEQKFSINPSIGIVVSGRSIQHEDAQTVIGPMFNTIPCAIQDLPETADFSHLALACHRFNMDGLSYQHTPLRDIAKWLGRDPREPLFDSLFAFQKEQKPTLKHDLWHAMSAEAVPDYPLNFEVEQKLDGSFVLTLVVKQEYLSRSDQEGLLSSVTDLVDRMTWHERVLLPKIFSRDSQKAEDKPKTHSGLGVQVDGESDTELLSSTAMVIRHHVAELAGIDASKIGMKRPSLFELGLDSIDAMKLSTRLRNEGLKVAVSSVMQGPTVAEIEKRIRDSADEQNSENHVDFKSMKDKQDHYRALLALQHVDLKAVQRILPVTPMQEGLLLDYNKYYHVHVFELEASTDLERLKLVWMNVMSQHPILRTRFVAVESSDTEEGFLQLVDRPNESGPTFWHDAQEAGSLNATIGKMQAVANQHGLMASRLCVCTSRQEGKRYMVLGMAHASYDAWSLSLLHSEVAQAYLRDERIHPVDDVAYEYHLDVTRRQALSQACKSFWTSTLSDAQLTNFPIHSGSRNRPGPQFLERQSDIDLSSITSFCKSQGVTMQSLGLAIWGLTLAQYALSLDVCFGLVLSGRTTEAANKLLFPTFNTVLFRKQIESKSTKEEFLRSVHYLAVRVSEHQHLPLREAVKLARGLNNRQVPLFNTLFTYQKTLNAPQSDLQLYREVELNKVPIDPPYAVNIEMEVRNNALWWTIATQASIVHRHGVEKLFSTIEEVFKSLIEQPQLPVAVETDRGSSICDLPPVKLARMSGENASHSETPQDRFHDDDWSYIETVIRKILAEASKTDISSIKKTTGLFNLGLDSISAIKVAELLKKGGLRIPVSKIIEAQDLQEMAKTVEKITKTETPGQASDTGVAKGNTIDSQYTEALRAHDIDTDDIEDIQLATAGQKYMLDAWSTSQGRLFYPTFWLVAENVSQDRFQAAASKLSETMPMLRSSFLKKDDHVIREVLQVIFSPAASAKYKLPWSYAAQQEDDKLLVTLTLHHALYDAVSLQLIISELQRLCSEGSEAPTVNIDSRAFDIATNAFGTLRKAAQKGFWTQYLTSWANEGIQYAITKEGTFEARRVEIFEPHLILTSKLDDTLRRSGISIQALFFALCGRNYAHLREDRKEEAATYVVIGIYLANRSLDIPDLPTLAAPTFNVVPLKINVSTKTTLMDAAKEVQTDLAKISRAENCGVSLEEIWRWTGMRVDPVINFLRIPDAQEDETHEGEGEGEVSIGHAAGETREKMKTLGEEFEEASPFLHDEDGGKRNREMEWCLPTVDIEAKVEDAWLGVGVFAPENVLDEKGVKDLMEELKQGLEKLGDEAV